MPLSARRAQINRPLGWHSLRMSHAHAQGPQALPSSTSDDAICNACDDHGLLRLSLEFTHTHGLPQGEYTTFSNADSPVSRRDGVGSRTPR